MFRLYFLQTSRAPRVVLKCSMSYCFCLSIKFLFFLFLSIHFILCQPSPAYHVTNPFYNSLHFSGLLQTTGLPEIGSLCVCVSEMEWRLLYFMPIIHKDHGPLQFGLVNRSWRGNRRMFVESGQRCLMKVDRYPVQGGEREERAGKRVKRLCKSDIIIFTECKRYLNTW